MNYLMIDVETAGGFKNPRVYDLGGCVIDGRGNVIDTFSFIIEEVFYNDNLMRNAYYADKLPQYYTEIEEGKHTVATFAQARAAVLNRIKRYRIKKIFAYNANFDKNALNSTSNHLLHRDFIPATCNVEWHCAMGASLSTICQTRAYIENAPRTETGRVSVSAESVYRYVIDDDTFEEAHTGLADALIEAAILTKCRSYHKKMDTEPKPLQCYSFYWDIQHKAGWGAAA